MRFATVHLTLFVVGCSHLPEQHNRPPVGFNTAVATEHKPTATGVIKAVLRTDSVPSDPPTEQIVGTTQPGLRNDVASFLHLMKDDARGLANWNNAAVLGLSLGAAIGLRQDLDGDLRENTSRHPLRWNDGSRTIGKFGEAPIQIAGLTALYAVSRLQQNDELRDLSGSLFSAVALTGLSTLAVKAVANTDRPSNEWNGGQFGFPSYHTASSFTMAAVLDEYYGAAVGLPAYAVAGLVGWSRIDERDHDLSDVFFGAALGYVIGKSVAGRHLRDDSRVRILPWTHPTDGSPGLLFDIRF